MLTMRSLIGRTARTPTHAFPVTEVFFQEKTGHLRYVALHTRDAFDHDETLVAIGRFSPPPGEGDWALSLDEEEIRAAPGWDSGETYPHHVPVALEAWPPILVGPFGSTTSPLLLYAAMVEAEESTEPPEPPHHSRDPRVDRLERATRRLGGDVFGHDGYLGRLEDMQVDPQTMTITHFMVGEKKRSAPYARLRHMADDATHTVLNLDRASLDALPASDA